MADVVFGVFRVKVEKNFVFETFQVASSVEDVERLGGRGGGRGGAKRLDLSRLKNNVAHDAHLTKTTLRTE